MVSYPEDSALQTFSWWKLRIRIQPTVAIHAMYRPVVLQMEQVLFMWQQNSHLIVWFEMHNHFLTKPREMVWGHYYYILHIRDSDVFTEPPPIQVKLVRSTVTRLACVCEASVQNLIADRTPDVFRFSAVELGMATRNKTLTLTLLAFQVLWKNFSSFNAAWNL